MTNHWTDMTNDEALAAWDAGQSVWTCDMGGMGPGYEQCIQLMAFEMLRAMIETPLDWVEYAALADADRDAALTKWRDYSDKIDKAPGVKKAIEQLGPSGAQHGAAMNIASVFARHGYSKGIEMVDKDRRIQVSKKFPALT